MSTPQANCSFFLNSGSCTLLNCRDRHDVRLCSCGVPIQIRSLAEHMRGKRHRNAIGRLQSQQPQSNAVKCDTCQIFLLSRQAYDSHKSSEEHTNAMASRLNARSTPGPEGFRHCEVCDTHIPSFFWPNHSKSRGHLNRQRLQEEQLAADSNDSDKNGITVSCKDTGVDFGVMETDDALHASVAQTFTLTIKKTESNNPIRLSGFQFTSSLQQNVHGTRFSALLLGDSRWIRNRRPRFIVITFHPSYEGRYEDMLELYFDDIQRKERFAITRRVYATVGCKEDYEQLKPKSPYVKKKWKPLNLNGPTVSSPRPPTWSDTKWRVRLPQFEIPKALVTTAFGPNGSALVKKMFLPTAFDTRTYGKHFQVLIHIEEEQRSRDLDNYAMIDVALKPKYPRYDLEVPGLAESRPSVLVGDFILVKHHGVLPETWYEGRVHMVYETYVGLGFPSEFNLYKGSKVDVKFKLNRLPTRRMHQALTTSFNPARLLFPEREHLSGASAVTREQLNAITSVNRAIGADHEQMETVVAILNQRRGAPPFVIFGPPGTGKTVTVVESIRQLLIRNPDAHILACAPSNSAADLLALKLLNLGQNAIFRLNSSSREFKRLPEALRDFSLYNDNKVFANPTLEVMRKYNVIVSTCVSGGIPYALGVPRGHFSHIFIDEAGQATEPEVMIPVKTMADASTNVILAGDNKQLGPSIRSCLAGDLGLKQSYLFRIMAREMYDLEYGRGLTIVKLVKNWRSHSKILAFSNTMFYSGELQPCGDPVLTDNMLRSELVTRDFPLIFHGIAGRDQREASSPSFFNIEEATLVKRYCTDLIHNRRPSVRPKDIGIITPYHAQRCKIIRILPWSDIKVGSVEEFQGQERRVIIISTVRSSTDYVRYDIKHHLGFVADARRLNVAITRAQALLIVIGNPTVLSMDPIWRAFLNYVHLGKGWRGKKIEWNPEDPIGEGYDQQMREQAINDAADLTLRLRSLILNKTDLTMFDVDDSGDDDDDGGGEYVEGVWREEE